MKLLVTIPSSKPKQLGKNTLPWAARAGFKLRIFIDSPDKRPKYEAVIEDVNYNDYLDLQYNCIVANVSALDYAVRNAYDLLAIVPPNLKSWNDTEDMDKMVIEFQKDIASARRRIGEDTKLHEVTFDNGARVVRVVKL